MPWIIGLTTAEASYKVASTYHREKNINPKKEVPRVSRGESQLIQKTFFGVLPNEIQIFGFDNLARYKTFVL